MFVLQNEESHLKIETWRLHRIRTGERAECMVLDVSVQRFSNNCDDCLLTTYLFVLNRGETEGTQDVVEYTNRDCGLPQIPLSVDIWGWCTYVEGDQVHLKYVSRSHD